MDAERCTFSWLVNSKSAASVATSEPKRIAHGHTVGPCRDCGGNASTMSHSESIRGKANKANRDDEKPRASVEGGGRPRPVSRTKTVRRLAREVGEFLG